VGNRRVEGYRDTLQRHGLKAPESYVIASGEAADSDGETRGKKAMSAVLVLKPRPDAVFCFNDTVAVGAMVRAFEADLRIPRDMAVIGSGNFHYSSKLRVPLSSIDQRAAEIGERTARMIIALLQKEPSSRPRSVVLEPTLVVRYSSKLK
jgi:LacI family transcriptional regulator